MENDRHERSIRRGAWGEDKFLDSSVEVGVFAGLMGESLSADAGSDGYQRGNRAPSEGDKCDPNASLEIRS